MSDELDQLRATVAAMRAAVLAMQARLDDAEHVAGLALQRVTVLEHPMSQPLFLAKADGSGFQERTTEDGSTFRDFTDGRASTAAPMVMEPGARVLLTIPSVGTEYYVDIANQAKGLKLTTTDTGAGRYRGAILIGPTSDIDPAADTVLADFGTAAASPWNDVIAVNSDEEGQTGGTHWIDPSTIGGRVFGWWLLRINDDGTPVVGFNGTQGIACVLE